MLAFIGTEVMAMLPFLEPPPPLLLPPPDPVSGIRLNSTSATAFATTLTHTSSDRANPSFSTRRAWLPVSMPERVQGVTSPVSSSSMKTAAPEGVEVTCMLPVGSSSL